MKALTLKRLFDKDPKKFRLWGVKHNMQAQVEKIIKAAAEQKKKKAP